MVYIFQIMYWDMLISGGSFLNGAWQQKNKSGKLQCKLKFNIKMLEQEIQY